MILSTTNCNLIELETHHQILLKNFNLHHSFWSDSSKFIQHVVDNALLNMINKHDLSIILFREIITWKTRNIFNISDLTFASSYLTDKVEHCMTRLNIRQSSNYILISIRILLDANSNFVWLVKRRAWKLLNIFKLKKVEKEALLLRLSQNEIEIDAYTQKIKYFLQRIIVEVVSWSTLSRYVKSFWNEKCDEITKKTRRLRRLWSTTHDQKDWTNYMGVNDRKQKIIQKVKKLNFRQKKENIIDISTNLWRFARWAKNKSHKLSERYLKETTFPG